MDDNLPSFSGENNLFQEVNSKGSAGYFLVAVAQSVGLQRDHNEDALFVHQTTFAFEERSINIGLFIIADGMGGHENGEIASKSAVKTFTDYIFDIVFRPFVQYSEDNEIPDLTEIVQNGIQKAHQTVLRGTNGGGTTFTACLIVGDNLIIGHVGDSRCYILDSSGRVKYRTNDHTLVQKLLELGKINERQANDHPNKNIIYRALGQLEPLVADINQFITPDDGYILLCSDGLSGVVEEEVIVNLIVGNDNLSDACDNLVEESNKAGGPDNISVILLKPVKRRINN